MADDAPASVESTLEAAVSGGFDRPGFAHFNGKSEGNRHRGSLSRRATKRLLIATTGCRSNECWPTAGAVGAGPGPGSSSAPGKAGPMPVVPCPAARCGHPAWPATVRARARRMTRCRDGAMALRSTAAGFIEARELLRTIQGAKGVKGGWILEAALGRHRQEVTVDEVQGRPHSALSHVATIGLSGDIAR